jgi:hypothetical protein
VIVAAMDSGAAVGRVVVDSTSVTSIGYAVETRILEVEFRSGAVYRYFDVPSEVFGAFLMAESKGVYFNRAVKGRFGYARA